MGREYGYSKVLEEAISKQMEIQKVFSSDDENPTNLERSSFAPKRFPRRDTEPITKRRSRKEIEDLIEMENF